MMYEIQYAEVIIGHDLDSPCLNWITWGSDEDPVQLLKQFVSAVNVEQIDDVNCYWRVIEIL